MTASVVQGLDFCVLQVLRVAVEVVPRLPSISDEDWVTHGYDVPWNNLFVQALTVLAFAVPLFVLGHYILKGREVAK